MATRCVSIFVNGNEARIHTRDSKMLQAWTPILLMLPHPPSKSQNFDTIHIWTH